MSLSASPEQICIPVGAEKPSRLGGIELSALGVGRVPVGVECTLGTPTATTVVVIGAPADPTPDEPPAAVALEACEFATPSTSSIETARLTAPLGCAGTKVNARRLDPGEHAPYHTEGDQEELFVPVRGPATMRIDGDACRTPAGTVTRVAPPVPRSALNEGDTAALWVMIGAPPSGGPSEWDPGAKILE